MSLRSSFSSMVAAEAAAEASKAAHIKAQLEAEQNAYPLAQGTKKDDGKVRIDLIPSEVIFALATILTFGAKKYADRNWEKGILWGRVFAALMRHMWAWWAGKGPTSKSFLFGELDDETKHSHLWHALCCIAFLVAYEERGMTQFDDRPGAEQK
jgi:hypothetical protein